MKSGEKTLEIGRDDTDNLFDEETQFALNFAGEIGIEGDFESIEGEAVRILQKICSSIIKNWDERQTETPL